MLVRMAILEIANNWEGLVKPSIFAAAPPNSKVSPDYPSRLLHACLTNQMQVWAVQPEEDLRGVMVTEISEDDYTGEVFLFIYAMHVWKPLSKKEVKDIYVQLSKFARSRGATRLSAVTDQVHVLRMMESVAEVTKKLLIAIPIDPNG